MNTGYRSVGLGFRSPVFKSPLCLRSLGADAGPVSLGRSLTCPTRLLGSNGGVTNVSYFASLLGRKTGNKVQHMAFLRQETVSL